MGQNKGWKGGRLQNPKKILPKIHQQKMACTMTMNTSSDELVNIYHRKGMLLAGAKDRMDTGETENDSEAMLLCAWQFQEHSEQ